MDTLTVGLMADPGLPEKVAFSLIAGLSRDLARADAGVRWKVDVSRGTLPLTVNGDIPLLNCADQLREDHGWDYVVYLTDLPRSYEDEPMVCETSSASRAALVSLPALGTWRLQAKTRNLINALLVSVQEGNQNLPSPATISQALGRTTSYRALFADNTNASYIVLPGLANRVRLLFGMVHNNRPQRLLAALSGCTAAAAATGAFGIFYASIWNMSDALHPGRLAVITLVVIGALSGWLIVRNRLWNRVRSADLPRRALWDNVSTLITVGLGVSMMYGLLWAMLFLISLAVIASSYLQSQLGHPVALLDYGHLSWLAASLGTLAGALGSNFDSDDAIREATYSRREYQRRQLADNDTE